MSNRSRLEEYALEDARRGREFIRLYRPLPEAERFHRSTATTRILLGGNRAGKTLSGFCELASEVTGIPITTWSGEQIPRKWPDRPLNIWVIGYDETHLVTPVWRVLFEPDQYKTIQNPDGSWRTWDHRVDPFDSPLNSTPLIPPRFIKRVVMRDVKKGVPLLVELHNGHTIWFFSSLAEPKVGDPVDDIYVDDEIEHARHVAEWFMRLNDRRGRFIWQSIPSVRNAKLEELCEKADAQVGRENPDIQKFVLTLEDNPFIHADEKRKRREELSDEDWQVRGMGEFNTTRILVYPEFKKDVACIPRRADMPPDALGTFLEQRQYEVPPEWTHYLVLDPGHTKPGVLFGAVPPPDSFGDFILCYAEVAMLRGVDAYQLAAACAPLCQHINLHAMMIDKQAGQKTPEGFGLTICQQYEQAFRELGIRSTLTGSTFIYASPDKVGGVELVRRAMRPPRPGMYPRLRFIRHRCPETIRQLERYRKKTIASEKGSDTSVQDKPADRQKDDMADCVRYFVSYDPVYVPPRNPTNFGSPAYRFAMSMNARQQKAGAPFGMTMGMR